MGQSFKNSLVWRLSLVLFLLFVVIGISYVFFTANTMREYHQKTTQQLHAHVAEHMLLEVQPFVDGEVNEAALGQIMHSMMAVNPNLEVYLVDPSGEILSYVVLDKEVRLNSIELEPVQKFLSSSGCAYVLGDDPRIPGRKTIFSATEVLEAGQLLGYVYMVLASDQYETVSASLYSDYFMQLGTRSFVITLISALLISVALIFLLTRNLRQIIKTVQQYENGDLTARVPITSDNELAAVGRTFNQMADTLSANIEELKKVDRLRRDLIANVSHDLRSPMAVIQGYIETLALKNDSLTAEQRAEYFERVLRSSDKLERLVASLFELSKLESDQMELHLETTTPEELVRHSAEDFSLLASEKGLEFDLEVQPDLPEVQVDPALFQRVLQNLLDNAIKYTPEAGFVALRVKKEEEEIRFEIENSGPGIPSEDVPHLFDRYYRAQAKDNKGTGLGLAIVKRILDLHQSVIAVVSKANQSTTFAFSLPSA
ncbi:HAMP domain-containing histidine kinase [Cryomorphaceae bacterium]|nr:HAMP domain-containing histidine kinase [Cryomorphaceae bacterium]